jgi:hypothetical protein
MGTGLRRYDIVGGDGVVPTRAKADESRRAFGASRCEKITEFCNQKFGIGLSIAPLPGVSPPW